MASALCHAKFKKSISSEVTSSSPKPQGICRLPNSSRSTATFIPPLSLNIVIPSAKDTSNKSPKIFISQRLSNPVLTEVGPIGNQVVPSCNGNPNESSQLPHTTKSSPFNIALNIGKQKVIKKSSDMPQGIHRPPFSRTSTGLPQPINTLNDLSPQEPDSSPQELGGPSLTSMIDGPQPGSTPLTPSDNTGIF